MSSMNLTHFGRLGFESRNLSRRAHRADFHTEPLERRELLSTGQITPVAGPNPSPHVDGPVAPAPVVSTAVSASATTPTLPTAISATITANPPTNNSSTTNIPGVSPTVPATLNVATDDSPSVTTSPSSAISALIPEASGFVSFTGGPVFIVPMADSSISELAIESPESPAPNSTVLPQLSGLALILHPINAPMNFQTNLAPATLQNQPAVVVPPHVGQSLETELQKPVKPELGPDAGVPPLIDVVDPFKPLEPTQPGKTGQPRPEESKTQQPGTEQPKAEPPAEAKPTPMQELPPFWWLGGGPHSHTLFRAYRPASAKRRGTCVVGRRFPADDAGSARTKSSARGARRSRRRRRFSSPGDGRVEAIPHALAPQPRGVEPIGTASHRRAIKRRRSLKR